MLRKSGVYGYETTGIQKTPYSPTVRKIALFHCFQDFKYEAKYFGNKGKIQTTDLFADNLPAADLQTKVNGDSSV